MAEGALASRSVLIRPECFWRDHQVWLESKGYMLRPRYRPGWVPSWHGTKRSGSYSEDGHLQARINLLDATRIADGKIVMIKRIKLNESPDEVEITQMFATEPLVSDPRNHCVPVIEVLTVPDSDNVRLIVMPLLRAFNNPPFNTLGEVVECLRQLFEGLQFIHEQHIAHRDCMDLNIMMDPLGMFPKLYHPQDPTRTLDWKLNKVKHYSRTYKPRKYYFIDFGLSRSYDPADGAPRDLPVLGGDKTVPEFKDYRHLHDPFPTDIYYLGNMMRECFIQKFTGVELLASLVDDMVQDDPTKRPTIAEVVTRFEEMCKPLTSWQLRARLAPLNETGFKRVTRSSAHWVRAIAFILTRRSALPTPS